MITPDMAICVKILYGGSLKEAMDEGVQDIQLFDQGKLVFDFVVKHFQQYGVIPDVATVQTSIGVTVPPATEAPEPVKFYIDKVKERHLENRVKSGLKDALGRMSIIDPKGAVDITKDMIREINDLALIGEKIVDATKGTDARWAEYQRVKAVLGGMDGLPTPFPWLNALTQGIHPGETWITVSRTGVGKCVAAGTRLADPETGVLIRVEDIVRERRNVFTFDLMGGRVKSVVPAAWVATGRKGCLRVVTRLGREIKVTPEHPLLTSRGWVRADGLSLSDRIVGVARIPEPEVPKRMPESEVDLLAVLLSEGSFSGNHVGFSTADSAFLGIAENAAKELGMRVAQRGPIEFDLVGCMVENKRGSIARDFLARYGFNRERAKEKWLPSAVFSLSNEQLRRFLTVFWMADGYAAETDIGIGLASERLIDDIHHLLLRFGVVAKKRYKKVVLNGKEFDSWVLRVDSWCKGKFRNAFSEMPGAKGDRIRALKAPKNTNVDVVDVSEGMKQRILEAAKKYRKWDCALKDRRGLFAETAKTFGVLNAGSWGFKGIVDPHGVGRISRRNLLALVETAGGLLDDIRWMTSADIVFDEIVKIEDAGEQDVFDLSVEGTHNFVAEGIVCHNTWWLMLLWKHLWQFDFKPLIVSMEMTADKIERRFDAAYANLSYEDFKRGQLGTLLEAQYKAALDSLKGKNPLLIATRKRVKTVTDISLLIEELQPSCVLIDGIYKLRTKNAKSYKSMWENVSEVSDEIQELSQVKKIGIVGTTQFNREVKTGSTKVGTEKIGLADSIGQNADVIIGLIQTKEMFNTAQMLQKLIKNREDKKAAWVTNWDLIKMDFSEIREWTDADERSSGDSEENEEGAW